MDFANSSGQVSLAEQKEKIMNEFRAQMAVASAQQLLSVRDFVHFHNHHNIARL